MSVSLPAPAPVVRWFARAVVWLSILSSGLSVFGQESFNVLNNGPSANRINIVVLSEGYKASELAQFRIDVTNTVEALVNQPPFSLYRHMFNGYGIAVASKDSGADDPSAGVFKDTYFNATFDSYGTARLLTIPPNNFDYNSANGNSKVSALLNQFMPEWDIVVILVNDSQYGGAGGTFLTASKHASSAEIVRHEMGHSFAGLGDEYTTAYPGYPAIEEPNTTRETNRNNIKWKAWLKSSTPTPTPATTAYNSVVGLFQGAHYNTTGWYRPKLDCKMRTLNKPYCEVCSETLITRAYGRINAAGDPLTSAQSSLVADSGSLLHLDVNPLVPSETRSVQWSLNNVSIPGATNISLALDSALLVPGTNFIRCIVRDTTALVKNDPSNRLQGVVEWKVALSAGGQLAMDPPVWLGGGRLALRMTGYAPKGVVLQATSDFVHWTDLSVHGPLNGELNVTNIIPSSVSAVGFRLQAAE